jgi:enoyl-CoA hydratase/carnithine racemase
MIRLDEFPTTVRLTLTSPVLEMAVMDELGERLAQLALESPSKPLILTSAHPTIFLAGAHLGEIARLRARSSVPYAHRGRAVISRLLSHPAPTVAAVHGSC